MTITVRGSVPTIVRSVNQYEGKNGTWIQLDGKTSLLRGMFQVAEERPFSGYEDPLDICIHLPSSKIIAVKSMGNEWGGYIDDVYYSPRPDSISSPKARNIEFESS